MIAAVDAHPGRRIIQTSWVITAAFAVTAVPATVVPDLVPVAFGVALVAFLLGSGIFVVAYAAGVNRSRHEELGIGGWFLLLGDVAPKPVRRHLLGSLAAQCAVAIGTAAARPFSSLAFGTLVPMAGLACCGWWGGRHGRFGPRHGPHVIRTPERAAAAAVDQNAPHG